MLRNKLQQCWSKYVLHLLLLINLQNFIINIQARGGAYIRSARTYFPGRVCVCVCVGGGGVVTWLIFAGYVPLASQNSYPIIGYAVATL